MASTKKRVQNQKMKNKKTSNFCPFFLLSDIDFYKDGSEILEFARHVKGANIAKLIKGIQTLEYREELEKILKERENAKDEIDNELN